MSVELMARPPKAAMAICSGTIVAVGGVQGGVAEHELRLLPIGFVDQLDAPPLERHRRAQLERVRRRRGGRRETVEGPRQRGGERFGIDVSGEGEDQVASPEVAAEMRGGLRGGRRVERGRQAVDRMAVGVLAVDVAQEEALAQLAIVVAVLVDLSLDLLARAGKLGRRRRSGGSGCRRRAPGRRRGCAPEPRPRSGSCPARRAPPACRRARRTPASSAARERPPAPCRAHSAARLVSPSR